MIDFTDRTVVLDVEANRLVRANRIWCIVAKDIHTLEVFKFRPKSPLGYHEDFKDEFLAFAKTVKKVIGHNFLSYDLDVINNCFGEEVFTTDQIVDTLVMSRLFRPTPPHRNIKGYNRAYGHGLAAWGRYLGFPKMEFDDFSKFSEEQLTYCVNDVELNYRVYLELTQEAKGFSQQSIDLEMQVAYLLHLQEENGFKLDKKKAGQMYVTTSNLLSQMNQDLADLFPPVFKPLRNYKIKINQDGSLSAVTKKVIENYSEHPDYKLEQVSPEEYQLSVREEFNPQSSKQVAERLLGLGWKPKKYTDKGSIKTDKETMAEAIKELLLTRPDATAISALAKYNIVADRNQKCTKWLQLSNLEEWGRDGRVHGRVNPIGAGTHRCSHYDDNMANIARVVTGRFPATLYPMADFRNVPKFSVLEDGRVFVKYDEKEQRIETALTGLEGVFGWDSRDCWTVDEGNVLVGADASGIQLRALAHYMNDPAYTKALLEGDIHTVHQKAAGIESRNKAKTFIYAWLLGAGDEKIGSIVGVTESEYESLFRYASSVKKYGSDLLTITINKLKENNRKADKRTVATIVKGYKTKEQFLNRTPALKRLRKEDIPAATKQGYLIGIDGRKLWIPNEHLAMSLYLQGFEAVIMKQAMVFYQERLRKEGVPFKQVAFVHDEFEVETPKQYGGLVGATIVQAIRDAGSYLGSNCPLDGAYYVGRSWAEVH